MPLRAADKGGRRGLSWRDLLISQGRDGLMRDSRRGEARPHLLNEGTRRVEVNEARRVKIVAAAGGFVLLCCFPA